MEPIANKLPPQNDEAEQSVLGAIMISQEAMDKVADMLEKDDFYKEKHRLIYQAMHNLYRKSEPIDLLSLTNRLKDKKQLKKIGGRSYLIQLANAVATAANIKTYAEIVQRKATLRRLIKASCDINQLAYDQEEEIDELLDKAEQKIFKISQKYVRQDFRALKPMLSEAFERLDKLQSQDNPFRGLPTGFYDLDNILGGLQKADLITLAARPSLGKTSLALNIASHVALKSQVPVGIFSLEMSNDQLVDRLICAQSQVDMWKYRTGKLSTSGENNDFLRINASINELSNAPIFIDDNASSNVMQMRAMARRLQANHDLGLIIIDYLQLMEGRSRTESRVQEISEISRGLKNLARELNIPVLALSQLSRAVENRSPQIPKLSDLRESGSIEQDSDVVLFIYREDRENPNTDKKNIVDILIAKHRNGPIGKVDLYFNENCVRFENLDKSHTQDTPEKEENQKNNQFSIEDNINKELNN